MHTWLIAKFLNGGQWRIIAALGERWFQRWAWKTWSSCCATFGHAFSWPFWKPRDWLGTLIILISCRCIHDILIQVARGNMSFSPAALEQGWGILHSRVSGAWRLVFEVWGQPTAILSGWQWHYAPKCSLGEHRVGSCLHVGRRVEAMICCCTLNRFLSIFVTLFVWPFVISMVWIRLLLAPACQWWLGKDRWLWHPRQEDVEVSCDGQGESLLWLM